MMMFVTHTPAETRRLGEELAETLGPGDVVALRGPLGSGKTQFVLGACRRLGVTTPVGSPTFTLVNEYTGGRLRVFHVDLYRISEERELPELGLDEAFGSGGVCFVEWAERAGPILPADRYEVGFAHGRTEQERRISLLPPVGRPR